MLANKALSASLTANPDAWDITKFVYDAGSKAWDISTNVEISSTSVSGQETTPTGIFFKPDGSKMYICGQQGDDVNEYTLSTPWLITSKTFVQNFSVVTQESGVEGLCFKPDGTIMYIVGSTGDAINEYSLSTAWDISTCSHVQSFSVASQETTPTGIFFKPDGTKVFVVGQANDNVYEYSLSTAWDISTCSYVQSFSVATQTGTPSGVFFKPDGTKMYIVESGSGRSIDEFTLSTAWDISTCSFVQSNLLGPSGNVYEDLFFKPDGTLFYVINSGTDSVDSYSVAGEPTTGEAGPSGISFKADGTKMYIVGSSGDEFNEYSLSTAWDIYSATLSQTFSVSAQDTSPEGMFFKPDGTKVYFVGSTNDSVYEYTLSVAWDISTASYAQNFSVATQETVPEGLFFKPDGTKMYVVGSNGDDVNEYSLSTAWDISTASYVQNFSVASQSTNPSGVFFKGDGTEMYVTGSGSLFQYTLSTAWDISSATYFQTLIFLNTDTPRDVFFKPDGTQFFIIDGGKDSVLSYKID